MERGRGIALGSERHNMGLYPQQPPCCWVLSNINLLPPPPPPRDSGSKTKRHRVANGHVSATTSMRGHLKNRALAPCSFCSCPAAKPCHETEPYKARLMKTQKLTFWARFLPCSGPPYSHMHPGLDKRNRYKENMTAFFSISASLECSSNGSLVKCWEIPPRAKEKKLCFNFSKTLHTDKERAVSEWCKRA